MSGGQLLHLTTPRFPASHSFQPTKPPCSWTFYNTLTGRRQQEDPGGAPYIDELGKRHWAAADGSGWQDDPGPGPVNIVSCGQ